MNSKSKTAPALLIIFALASSSFFTQAQTDPAQTGYDPYRGEKFDDDVSEGASAGWLDCSERTDLAWYSKLGNFVKCSVVAVIKIFRIVFSLPETILNWIEETSEVLFGNLFAKLDLLLSES
ncbi:MAG TPA: hypothetical protein ENN13_03860 [Candidatus Altiarchaeales archaeon]|nr:hypothetical protein [Candidatus Altiarchaeales archaeon]